MAAAVPVMRVRAALLAAVASCATALAAPIARGDDGCLDASEEARAMLGKKRLLDARANLRICAASSCDETVRALCEERLAEVTERLPSVIFDAKDGAGHDLADVKLTIDGAPQDVAVGVELTLDPGAHTFVFEVPGEHPQELRLVLVERDKGRREHVVFGAPPPPAPAPAPPSSIAPSPPPERRTSALGTAGWITIAAGAVGVGIGAAYGITAIAKNDDARCDASNVCDDPRSRHEARIAAGVSTVAFVTGGVLAATGGVLVWLGRPRPARQAATLLRVGPSGMSFAGAW